jgi:hypothetical protein
LTADKNSTLARAVRTCLDCPCCRVSASCDTALYAAATSGNMQGKSLCHQVLQGLLKESFLLRFKSCFPFDFFVRPFLARRALSGPKGPFGPERALSGPEGPKKTFQRKSGFETKEKHLSDLWSLLQKPDGQNDIRTSFSHRRRAAARAWVHQSRASPEPTLDAQTPTAG